jgi:hypothetical protein
MLLSANATHLKHHTATLEILTESLVAIAVCDEATTEA